MAARVLISITFLLAGIMCLLVGIDFLPRLPLLGTWDRGIVSIDELQGRTPSTDLLVVYGGARALLEGGDPYQPSENFSDRYLGPGSSWISLVNFHSPTGLALLLPLTPFSFRAAAAIWAALMIGTLIAVIRAAGAPWHFAFLLGPLVLLLPPVAFATGQFTIEWLGLATLAFAIRRRSFAAGVVIGLASLTKYLPALLLIPLLFRRQWGALVGFVAVWCIATGVIAALEFKAFTEYLATSGPRGREWIAMYGNGAFIPFLPIHFGLATAAFPLALALGVLACELARLRAGGGDERGHWARWNWLSVALVPSVNTYSLVPLALSAVLLFQRRRLVPTILGVASFIPVVTTWEPIPGVTQFMCIAGMGLAVGLDGLSEVRAHGSLASRPSEVSLGTRAVAEA